jgi:hypothetical protein
VRSWHHRLKEAGHKCVSIGKLHFRSIDDDNGFTEEVMPLHVVEGIGDPAGWPREPLVERRAALRLARQAGPGDSDYQGYDGRITDAAVDRLKARAASRKGKPWALFVSLVCPHFPMIARPEWYGLYPEDKVRTPALHDPSEWPDHPLSGRSASAKCTKKTSLSIPAACNARSPRILASSPILCGSQCRPAGGRAGGERPRGNHAYHLFERSRRQSRHARAVGQIDDVRGVRRSADDRRRAGTAARPGVPRAGVAG